MASIEDYKRILHKAVDDLEFNGKTIQEACTEHASLYLYYFDKYCEIKTISEKYQIEIDKVIGELTIKYNENYSIALGSVLMSKYINQEPELVKIKKSLVDINEIKEKFMGVVESFKIRGFQLNNITKLRVAQIEEGLL